ncbi:thioredoxin family protein [Flavobacterium piscinae]|uniref:thioredoxin family protein n=1 Tax=Flavobacterium piscinae TaxID=2506424 RepID=UPI001991E7D4|nr:thioredoxin family protein [Flavobacterium piscinae]MBC8884118.1 thioredoxin family protein [Flavobacterium piscinae]
MFIDFYTTWCAPCKKLEKLIFQNDSIQKIIGKDFVLLKYDAEKDIAFNLSKKHHVSSYPTAIILNQNGYVINRKYGFPGKDLSELSNMVLEFTNKSIELNNENFIIEGYSNTIDISNYPKFYIDFINRTNTKLNISEIDYYFNNTKDKFSEEYFSTLIYFGRDATINLADIVLNNKQRYIDLYGEMDVETLLFFLASAKFKNAISEINQEKYDEAVMFIKKH